MRRLLLCVALVASVRTGAAQPFLFVSAASQNRVDSYRVYDDGTPSASPLKQHMTGGIHPRRIISAPGSCNLYVAEDDRVEVFRIHAGGALEAIGATRKSDKLQSHDIKLSPDGTALYVPVRKEAAIGVYPLDAEGKPSLDVETENKLPAGKASGCIFGPSSADWEDMAVANDKLYAAYANRVVVYGIVPGLHCSNDLTRACTDSSECIVAGDCDSGKCKNDPNNKTCATDADCQGICASSQLTGAATHPHVHISGNDPNTCYGDGTPNLDDPNDRCATYSTIPANVLAPCIDPEAAKKQTRQQRETCSFSFRSHMEGGVGLVVQGTTLVVGQTEFHTLQGFILQDDGNFPPITTNADPMCDPTKKEKKQERKSRKKNKTEETIRYIGLTIFDPPNRNPVIYGAGYSGRTDAFRLNDDGTLPKTLSSATFKDVTSTPVRTSIGFKANGNPMLYVAAGERDRIQAFALEPEGSFDPNSHAIETNELSGSYPNDVLFKDITGCD